MNKGTLYLIPSSLSDAPLEGVLPNGTLSLIGKLNIFIVEEIRTARRFLISAGIKIRIEEITFLEFNEHSDRNNLQQYLEPLLNGADTGLLSEAGVPCIADPGSIVVMAAHRHGIRVVPLTGPSSIVLALMASGFNGQNFTFHGYLPSDKKMRTKRIKEIERFIRTDNQTQIFIETPYRNLQLFEALVATCNPATLLCIASDISGSHEIIETREIRQWKTSKPAIHKVPAIFLLSENVF